MKQETPKNGKKWLWIIAALVLVLAIVGLVLALVLGGSGANVVMNGRADLYWNIDRLTYLKMSTTGQTAREPAEDGLYHIRFAYNGEQVEYAVADRTLVNYIDTMEVMNLVVDNDGVITEAKAATSVANEIGAPLYVQRTTSNLIIANAAAALNSVSTEISVTENTQIYDVTAGAEKIGAVCTVADLGSADVIYVYANGNGEITHIYLVSHPVRSAVYWAEERMYSSANKSTTREPDENGIYTVRAYSEGEMIDLKFKDKDLVTLIDKKNRHSLHFGVTMDQDGFVMQVLGSDEALGATIPVDRYLVTEVEGNRVKAQKFGSSPKEYDLYLDEECPIYEVSKAAMVEGRQGQLVDSLEWGDRITVWTDGNGKPILIYVSNSLVENVPVFYSPARKYSTAKKSTTREPDSNGYYEIELYKAGDTGLTKYKTQDKALVDYLDSISVRIFGLIVDENNIIQRVYDPESIYGYTQFTTGRTVDSIIGPFVTAITIGKPMDTLNAAMSTTCQVYNASGYGDYGRTMLEVGDHIVANRGFDGYADTDIMSIFISRRLLGEDKLYFILDHSWDSAAKQSTRKPDEDGWYRIPVAHLGQQKVVRTMSKAMVDKMESFSPGAVCLELSGDVVIGAYDPTWATGGKKVTSGYRIVSFGENNTLTANLKTTYTEIKLAEDVVYYNVSDAYYDHKGEQTYYLTIGDQITAFTDRKGEVKVVFVRGRETNGMYTKTEQLYDSKAKQTLRVPDAEGYYHFDMYCDGEFVSYKTNDLELANKIESQTYNFGLVVDDGIIRSCVSTSWVKNVYGTSFGGWDVVAVDGNEITVKYNVPGSANTGVTKKMYINSSTKVYDISPTAENFGRTAKIQVGDRIRAYNAESNKERQAYVYIISHDTRVHGQEAYCEHCQQVVFWNPWLGTSFGKGDGHYYLNADVVTPNQISVYNEALQYEVVLDLNGHTYHVEGNRAFAVYQGETMTVMDSVGGGCLSATGATGGYGGVFTLVSKGTLNLLSGTIKGVESEDQTVVYGGTIYATGFINIYGGEIIGGVAKADTTLEKTTAYGGAIMTSGATVNMYGGKISGGVAENYEYTVTDEVTGEQTAKVNDGRGGNVYITGSTFNMYGGEIVDGNASHGGNIYVSNSTFNMLGGTISGGVATNGGNAYIYDRGTLVTSGDALITGGVSTRGASRNNGGGNIFVYTNATVVMEGGSITDGTAVSYGGNITCRGGELVIKDGIISGGKSETAGDNVYINGTSGAGTMMVAGGGQIVDGNVYIHKPAEEGRINIGLTGAPVIEELDLTSGAVFEMYDLQEGTDVTINGAGTLSAPCDQAQAYVDAGYFKHIESGNVIKVAEDNTLFVAAHCDHCDQDVEWINWSGEMLNTTDVVDGGHYILTKDIETSSQIRIGADAVADNAETPDVDETAEAIKVSVCINLNGHTITNKARAFAVYAGSTLSLVNSSETESLVIGTYNRDVGGVINLGADSNLNLYDNIRLESAAETFESRGGIINIGTGTFNMYGGTIVGRTAASGGAVYVSGGTFNMKGGLISGGTSTNAGGNIYLNGGELNISGGIIENGFADNSNGGNIYMTKGTLNVSGDAIIRGGKAIRSAARTNGGGNIYGQDNTVINVSGGQILNGETNSFGGNILCRGTLTVSGGLISGGTAVNGGNVFMNGYNVASKMVMTGGTIENGTATTGELDNPKLMVKESYNGDNIYATSATVEISGGMISDNDGGNAVLAATSKEERPATVILTLADNADLIAALDAKVYLVKGAQIAADMGGTKTDSDGDKIWVLEGFDVEAPTEPSTVPTEPSTAPTEPTPPTEPPVHNDLCPHCGVEAEWIDWDGGMLNTTEVVNGGHYVLTKDVNTSSQIRIGAEATDTAEAIVVSVCIDLNGHNITNKARAFAVYAGSTLTLVNNSGKESIVSGAYNKDVGGVINLSGATSLTGASNLNLYDGITLESNAETFEKKGGIVNMGTGTFNMYGGTIVGRTAASGGAVYVNGGTFNMEGGLITGGSATASGGNVYLNGTMTMSGGRIENGLADGSNSSSNGGNIYIAKGELTVSGDAVITGGTGTRATARTNGGGNIYGQDKTVINITGGQITNGTATSFGGNVYGRGTVTISGGLISGGTAANGGNVFVNGYSYAGASFTMTGGTIENGTATTGELDAVKLMVKESYDGDNVYVTSASATIRGGMITDNDGGNAVLALTSKTENVAIVTLTVANNEDLANALDGKVYLVSGAVLNTDLGATVKDSDGDEVWYKDATPTEPTEPSTAPTEPSTEPSVPGTEPTVPGTEPTEPSTEPTEPPVHNDLCPHCGVEAEWIDWDGSMLNTTEVVNGGHYVLTKDINTSSQIRVGADAVADNAETPDVDETAEAIVVSICIDLNGHSVTNKARAFAVYAGSTLTLVNNSAKESVVTGAYNRDVGGVINLGGASNLNLYDGITLESNAETFEKKGGIVNMGTGTFNMYGGTINGNTSAGGGSVCVNGGTLNMGGGLISGGTSTNAGGNIYLNGGVLNISGGVIEDGFADNSNGGNIYMTKGTLNVSGDAIIRNGRAIRSAARTNGGGNIYGQDKTVINISGGQIMNGETNSFGGNVLCRGTLTVSGGLISGGTAVNGGNVFVSGYAYAGAGFVMTGGTIENGTATTGELDAIKLMVKESYDGDNVYVTSASATISGGMITDNDGGNAVLALTSKTENVASVTLAVAQNADLANALDGKVYLVSGAVLNTDLGATVKDSDGDEVWYKDATPTEPTEPSTEPTEPSTAPTEPSTEPSVPGTEPTVPGTEPTEPSTEPTEPEAIMAECPQCGKVVEWTEWTGGYLNKADMNGSHFILTKDITSGGQIQIGANAKEDNADTPDVDETAEAVVVSVCIDLNGHSISKAETVNEETGAVANYRIFAVYAGSTLSLVNNSETESVITGSYNKDVGGVINLSDASNLNLHEGITLKSSAQTFGRKGGIVNLGSGTFNMYGGTIIGQVASSGGAVYVGGGTFNMEGGLITGGTATSSGGNVYLNGTMTMSGGRIENGLADGSNSSSNGGNIYIAKGELTVSGDAVITGGTGTRATARTNGGGNIYGQDKTVINITGGQITNGTATSFGGNVYGRGTITISGGLISGGTAANGGNVFISGYSVAATLNITGGTIENGTATTGELCNKKLMVKESYDGANIFATSATVNISGGMITDNDGGNAVLAFTSKTERPAVVNLTVAGNEALANALDGKVYLISGAELNADIGGASTDADGDMIWNKEAPATEPTEPSTEPTEPSTAPTEPSTEPTEPSTAPTEPSTEPTEPSTAPTEPSTAPTEPSTEPTEPSTAPTEPEEIKSICPHCNKEVVWTEWNGGYLNTADVDGGHFILIKDATTGGQIQIGADAKTDNAETPDVDETAEAVKVTVCVDLNGHVVTKAGRALAIYNGSTLNLMNTSETESVVTGSYNADRGGVINLTGESNMNLYSNVKLVGAAAEDFKYNGGVIALAKGNFTMNGGTIVGQHAVNGGAIYTDSGSVTIAGGVVNGGTATFGGAIYVNGGSLVISGGEITGGTATSETTNPFGGNVYVEGSAFAMTGGKLSDGEAVSTAKTPGGGNLYLRATSSALTITGGTIENGISTNGNGGNVYLNVGTLNISGDAQIIGGEATRAVARTNGGGNVYAQASTTLNIDGGKILNGTSASYGGNILARGTVLVTNGLISGGSALNGGNLFINGYDRVATCTISGGTIENGTSTTGKIDRTANGEGYNANIYVNSAVLNITGGSITDNDGDYAVVAYTHPNSIKDGKEFGAVVNLVLADKADLADALDGKIYIISGAVLNADIGGTTTNEDGDIIWVKEAPATEPTEPSTEATEPSTAPTEPSTEATEPSTAPTEPSTEATEPSTAPTEPSTEATEPSTEPSEPAVEVCPHCGEEISKISYIEWTTVSGGTVSASGHYYLTASVEGITSQMKIGTTDAPVDVYLDLRGNSISGKNVRIFSVYAGSALTIVDTVGGGELLGAGNGGNVIHLTADATFNLYDATLTNTRTTESTSMGGVVNTTDGTAETPSVFNMYSGTLNGGNHAGNGGAVCVRKYAEFNMYGGTVYGATCTTEGKTPSGAAVATRDKTSVVRIYGGTIVAGVSEGLGDCVYIVAGATFVVEGGYFLGGDVYIKTVGENAIVLSGTVEFTNLDLTCGGIITIGEGGVDGVIGITANEGVVCAATENAGVVGSYFYSLNSDLVFAVNADSQIILTPATKGASTLVNAAVAGALRSNLLP